MLVLALGYGRLRTHHFIIGQGERSQWAKDWEVLGWISLFLREDEPNEQRVPKVFSPWPKQYLQIFMRSFLGSVPCKRQSLRSPAVEVEAPFGSIWIITNGNLLVLGIHIGDLSLS